MGNKVSVLCLYLEDIGKHFSLNTVKTEGTSWKKYWQVCTRGISISMGREVLICPNSFLKLKFLKIRNLRFCCYHRKVFPFRSIFTFGTMQPAVKVYEDNRSLILPYTLYFILRIIGNDVDAKICQ